MKNLSNARPACYLPIPNNKGLSLIHDKLLNSDTRDVRLIEHIYGKRRNERSFSNHEEELQQHNQIIHP